MKKATLVAVLALLFSVSALSCHSDGAPETKAESLRLAAAPANQLPNSNGMASLASLESDVVVQAQVNPKELTLSKANVWGSKGNSPGDEASLEFTAGEAKTLSFELLFDTFEKGDVHEEFVKPLLELADPLDDLGRPPRVVFVWGQGLPAFESVIESISTKYTMFLPDGTPTRATCTVTLRESSNDSCSDDSECANGERCQGGVCRWPGK